MTADWQKARSIGFYPFHKWTPWEQYEWTGGMMLENDKTVTVKERRQHRYCIICKREEDELVRLG